MSAKRTKSSIVGGFVPLPLAYFKTPEFAALSGRAVKLLVELAMKYRGSNNGALTMTRDEMAKRGFRSVDQMVKARDELINTGWIMITRQGGKNATSLFAITWEPIDPCGGVLDVAHGPMPPHLWKPENAKFRETKQPESLNRRAVQVEPPHGTALNRHAVQANQH